MVKHGQKQGQKTGISIQNTSTLTRGQMKIRVFTGLAGSLHSAQRKKVRHVQVVVSVGDFLIKLISARNMNFIFPSVLERTQFICVLLRIVLK